MTTHLNSGIRAVLCGALATLTLCVGCVSEDRPFADADTLGDTDACSALTCSDNDPCTTDQCVDGRCSYPPIDACELCQTDGECTVRACHSVLCLGDTNGACDYTRDPLCEVCDPLDDTCDDDKLSTEDQCSPLGECVFTPISCTSDDPCIEKTLNEQDGCVAVNVCTAPSVAPLTPPAAVLEGEAWVLDGSYDGHQFGVFMITVDYGDDTDPVEVSPLPARRFQLGYTYANQATAGSYKVTVTVTDEYERSASTTVDVAVLNAEPVVSEVVTPDQVFEGSEFTVTGVVEDPGTDTLMVSVTFDDDAIVEVVADETGAFEASHTYADDGVYEIGVDVDDGEGATSGTFRDLTVENVDPDFEAPAVENLLEGTPKSVTLTVVDPGSDTFSGTIDFRDGTAPQPLEFDGDETTITFAYATRGTYNVIVAINDDDGGRKVGIFEVVAGNVAPNLETPGAIALSEGSPLALDVAFDDPGENPWTATVEYSPGVSEQLVVDGQARLVPIRHTYPNDYVGTMVITLSDGQESDLEVVSVVVSNVAPQPNAGIAEVIDEGSEWVRDLVLLDPGADSWDGTVNYDAEGSGAAETLVINQETRAYSLSNTYPNEGSFSVSVTIVDSDLGEMTETVALTVQNVAPTIDCGGNALVAEGGSLDRVCAFVDPGADSWTGSVDYGDGSAVEDVTISDNQFPLSHTYDIRGTYTVTVTVNDGTEDGVREVTVAVGNAPPLVDAGDDATITEGDRFVRTVSILDAGVNEDFLVTVEYGLPGAPTSENIGNAREYELDQSYANNHNPSDGPIAIVVTVTEMNGDGEEGQDTLLLSVLNAAPTVEVGADATATEGATFSRSIAFADPGVEDVLTASVDYGDGGVPVEIPLTRAAGELDGTFDISRAYLQDGVYPVTIVVSDTDGGSVNSGFTVVVDNAAPVLSMGDPATVAEGGLFTRTVSFTDSGADTHTAEVNFGDGGGFNAIAVGNNDSLVLSHTYLDDRATPYQVTVRVNDGAETSEGTLNITVTNKPPVVSAEAAPEAAEGALWQHVIDVSDAGVLDTFSGARVRYQADDVWKSLMVGTQGEVALSNRYAQDGTYGVLVEVTDNAGDTGTLSFDVVITNVVPVVSTGDPLTVDEGSAWTRIVTFSDPGADTWIATVDYVNGDGFVPATTSGDKKVQIGTTYPNQNTHKVVVRVNDGAGEGTSELDVTVLNAPPTVDAGGPTTISEGGTLTRDGIAIDPGINDVLSGSVDYGDNTGSKTVAIGNDGTFTLSHPFTTSGTFTVTVTADDDEGGVGADSFIVTVSNSAPTVNVGGDVVLNEGSTLQKTVSFTDEGADTWTATANFGDGPEDQAVNPTMTINLTHTYPDDGAFTVEVAVSDGTETGFGDFGVTVNNVVPVVVFGDADVLVSVNEGAEWNGAGSFTDPGVNDPHAGSVTYVDGGGSSSLPLSAEKTFSVSHTYPDDGVFNVSVSITDDDGVGMGQRSVTVNNVAPVIPPFSVGPLDVGVPWSRTIGFNDPGADVWSGSVNFGEGPALLLNGLTTRSFDVDHTYNTPGSYALVINVNDDDGGTGTLTVPISVSNVLPTVTAGSAQTVDEGDTAMITTTFHDTEGETHTAVINWGDGTIGPAMVDQANNVVTGSHTYADNPDGSGAFQVIVQVTDEFGGLGADSLLMTVHNVAPVVNAGDDTTSEPTGLLVREITWVDPGADDFSVTVNFGDGTGDEVFSTTTHALDLTHTYETTGMFLVSVTVDDGDMAMHTDTFLVTVALQDCSELDQSGIRWIGGAVNLPNSWHEASNWAGGAVPDSSTDVYICADAAHYPVVQSAEAFAKGVALSETAQIQINSGRRLVTAGSVTGGTLVGSGTLEMLTDTSVSLGTSLTNLLVKAPVVIDRDITATGNVVVIGDTNRSLDLGGRMLTVRGNLTSRTTLGGVGLRMNQTSDLVLVKGNATFTASTNAGNHPSELTAGELHFEGNLTSSSAAAGTDGMLGHGFIASGAHRTVCVGSCTASLDMSGPNGARFGRLGVPGTSVLTLAKATHIGGLLTIESGGRLSTADAVSYGSRLPSLAVGANYSVRDSVIVGAITMTEDFAFPTGDVRVADAGLLDPAGNTLTTPQDFTVTRSSGVPHGLLMDDGGSQIVVGRDAVFMAEDGAADLGYVLTQGSIHVGGNFVAGPVSADGVASFRSVGTTVVFTGNSDHTIVTDSAATNTLATLELDTDGSLKLLSTVVTSALLHDADLTTEVSGGFQLSAQDLNVRNVIFEGTRLRVRGEVSLMEDITFGTYDGSDNQLTLVADQAKLTLSRLDFQTIPTSGAMIVAEDPDATNGASRLAVLDSVPAYGIPFTTAVNFQITWGDIDGDEDEDYLSNGDEITLGADYLDPDTDGDTFLDGTEHHLGHDPNDMSDVPYTFTDGTAYVVGQDPRRLAIADVTGDGRVDIVVTNRASAFLSVLEGGASGGSFPTTSTITVGGGSEDIVIGDVLQGGRPEIVISQPGENQVRVFQYKDLGLGADWLLDADHDLDGPVGLSLGDYDNDGSMDFSVSSATDQVIWHAITTFSTGEPPYHTLTAVCSTESAPNWLATGYINSGDILDTTTANFSDDSVTLCRNQGSQLNWNETQITLGPEPRGIAIGDIAGSNEVDDLSIALAAPDGVYILTKLGISPVTINGPYPVGAGSRSVALVDLDGNGRLDIVTASEGDDVVSVLLQANSATGRGLGEFYPHAIAGADAGGEHFVAIEDFNHDGLPDLVTINSTTNTVFVTLQE